MRTPSPLGRPVTNCGSAFHPIEGNSGLLARTPDTGGLTRDAVSLPDEALALPRAWLRARCRAGRGSTAAVQHGLLRHGHDELFYGKFDPLLSDRPAVGPSTWKMVRGWVRNAARLRERKRDAAYSGGPARRPTTPTRGASPYDQPPDRRGADRLAHAAWRRADDKDMARHMRACALHWTASIIIEVGGEAAQAACGTS